jgi:hypothetical protein
VDILSIGLKVECSHILGVTDELLNSISLTWELEEAHVCSIAPTDLMIFAPA